VRLLCESEGFAYPCEPLAFTETFSCSTLEACAAGCATIISSADCLDEVHGHAAAVVRAPVSERLGEFTDLVVRGLTEHGFRSDLARLGRAHAEGHDWRELAGDLEKGIVEKKRAQFAEAGRWALYGEHAAVSLEKPRIDLVLTKYGSGEEPIDVDHPFDSNSGGGCRAGFMGLVRELPKLGYEVHAYSTFKRENPIFAAVRTLDVQSGTWAEYHQIENFDPK